MANLTVLDIRARVTQICNAGLAAGLDPATISMTLGSVSADLNLQMAYRALSELQAENDKKVEEDTDV